MIFHIDEASPKQIFKYLKDNKHCLPDDFMTNISKSFVYKHFVVFFCLACNVQDLIYIQTILKENRPNKPKDTTIEAKHTIIKRYVTLIGDLK